MIEPGLAAPAALDVFTLGAAQQHADVVAGLALVEQLAEHLDTGTGGLDGGFDADDLDFLADLDDAALGDRSPPVPRPEIEHVLDRHQEGLVDRTLRRRDVSVERVGRPAVDRASPISGWSPPSAGRAEPLTMGMSSPGKSYSRAARALPSRPAQQFASSTMSHLFRKTMMGHANLTRQQDVLARLRHRAVGAATTRIAPSICAAPVIMFLT